MIAYTTAYQKSGVWHIKVTDGESNLLVDSAVNSRSAIQTEGIAILSALKRIQYYGIKNSQVRTSSRMWAEAISQRWRLKDKDLFKIRDWIYRFVDLTESDVFWIPQEMNIASSYYGLSTE